MFSTPPLAPSLTDEQEDELPVLLPIAALCGPHRVKLFIGNRIAADNAALLRSQDITSTMNLAVNVEMAPLALGDGTFIRRTHIGLIDGPGNTANHLLAAVLALDGILGQASPGKAHYPPHRAGNVLVHCRGGRSRSASVIALYLHLAQPAQFPSLDAALDHIRAIRKLDADQPAASMIALARTALESAQGMRFGAI
ncbi:dual specificity protein phosphatase family protein [Kaistia terrae]|uniref:Dual specificity protein phosphatase family protein n=1 Tax=Kaistia terrae TaxID=537017 RepID=A0ABW0PPK8_9HYPH|nr:dual specificity protein phosphatase [Kaistia terrae]MCX5577788.1 dual specificity protein phosphatase [Kaistia terrae]